MAVHPATDGDFGSKYRTEGNVGRGPLALGNCARRGSPVPSIHATALFVVPKSRPTQKADMQMRILDQERLFACAR